MRLAEVILSALSRHPEAEDPVHVRHAWTIANALDHINGIFPDFQNHIVGRRVLDFGSGMGYQVVAMAKHGARLAVGIEPHSDGRAHSIALAAQAGLDDRTGFAEWLPEAWHGQFDVVISQNSMEHYPDPDSMLTVMRRALDTDGKLFITFGPPWYAPWGAHMRFFTGVPWVNLLFSERTVMSVRSRYRSDKAQHYEEVESGLNRMSVAKFERIVRNAGLTWVYQHYECVKGVNILAKLPLLRELFVNRIDCILTVTR